MKKNIHIKKLSNSMNLGLGTFLVVGLSGCDVDKNCNEDNMKYLSQKEQLECKNKKTYNTAVATTGSTTTKSGFFSSSSGHLSSTSSHISSGG